MNLKDAMDQTLPHQ